MSTWYTADTHFGHSNILHLGEGRPFADIAAHDWALISRWNERVQPDDVVWHLGDFSMSITAMERVVPRLNGRIHLVAGNHDGCWTAHPSTSRRAQAVKSINRYLAAGFHTVYDSGVVADHRIGDLPVMLSHLPAMGDHFTEHRYAEQRPDPGVLPLLCAHVHQSWLVNGRQINVGVDQWGFAPVHSQVILELIAKLPPAV